MGPPPDVPSRRRSAAAPAAPYRVPKEKEPEKRPERAPAPAPQLPPIGKAALPRSIQGGVGQLAYPEAGDGKRALRSFACSKSSDLFCRKRALAMAALVKRHQLRPSRICSTRSASFANSSSSSEGVGGFASDNASASITASDAAFSDLGGGGATGASDLGG